ncbi:hypothetical protein A4X13_0g8112, partial [Tilletia indica]
LDNFDAELRYKSSGSKSKSKYSSSSDSDSSDSDSDEDHKHRSSKSHRRRRHKKNKASSSSSSGSSSELSTDSDSDSDEVEDKRMSHSSKTKHKVRFSSSTPALRPRPGTAIDDLTRQLADLDVSSAEYRAAWVQLAQNAPHVAANVARPAESHSVNALASRVPPHLNMMRPLGMERDARCFGCGETTHQMRSCEALRPYFDERILIKDHRGYTRTGDGSPLPPYTAVQPLVKSLREMGIFPRTPAHGPPPAVYGWSGTNSVVNFVELGDPPLSAPVTVSTYGADRHGQQQQERNKPYDRPPVPAGPAARTRSAAAQVPQHQLSPSAPPFPPSIHFDAAPPAATPYASIARSAPVSNQPPAAAQVPASVVGDADMTDAGGEKKRPPRRYTLASELSKSFPTHETLQKALDNPVTISTGALLAQPEIQKMLGPMLQRHKSFDVNVVDDEDDSAQDVSLLEPKLQRALLSSGVGRAQVSIAGNPVTAILDSGSEINVISRATCDRLRLPLTAINGTMRTADGRISPMTHLCCNVDIEICGIWTRAHLHVINGPKYELLLGRPWQRQVRFNHRDIDEGLLVTIHDPSTLKPHSFIAAPAEQSDPRSAYSLSVSETEREISHLVCSLELEELLEDEDCQEENALLAGNLSKRTDSEMPSVLTMYKPVARKVRPVATTITEDDRVRINIPSDFEVDMPSVPFAAPLFQPGKRLTRERLDELDLDADGMLNEDELALLTQVLLQNEHALAFDESEKGVVDENIVPPVKIPVVEHEIWDQRKIPISAAIKEQVMRLLQEKIDSGLYEHSSAGYTSKWFPVAKKQKGQFRLVHDLQPLNAVTARNPGRLPQIDTFVGELSGKACIGTLDHFSGFDQVWLAVESRDYTSFETELGRLRHTRLPQGGTNSCIVFHYIVVAIVGPKGKVYVDDTFVPGPTSTYNNEPIVENPKIRRFVYEYLVSLNCVLFRIGKSNMTVSARKMGAIRRTAEVLGQEVSPEGRRVAKGKVEAIERWERCSSVTEVRSFLGTAGQGRSWIPNYSTIVKPLTQLTRKDAPFVWGPDQQAAMDTIKEVLAQRTYLVELKYGEDEPPIKLGVDAGPLACGFWLGQDDSDAQTHVARYGSLPFNDREQAYSQAKRELYAIFRALKFFRHWLWGTRVIVLSDARFIKGMLANPELPNSAMVRWLAYIMLFDIEVVHVKAKDNELADGLSRRPVQPDDEAVTDDDEWLQDRLDDAPLAAMVDGPSFVDDLSPSPVSVNFFQLAVSLEDQECLAVDAENPPSQLLTKEHQSVYDFLSSGKKPSHANDFHSNKAFIKLASQYFLVGKVLWRRGGIEDAGRLVVDDVAERERLMRLAHEESGHKSVGATSRALELRFFWSKMASDVKEWLKTCDPCQRREKGHTQAAIRFTIPPGPGQRWGLDITYMPKALGYRFLVVARDDLSGWVEARPLKRKTARGVARFLFECVLTRHGLPLQITTDQGTEFKGVVDILLSKYKVDITRTSAYNPRANGAVERGHSPLKEAVIHASRTLGVPWTEVVELACWFDRTTVRRQYGQTPFFLLHGHEPLMPLDLTTPLLLEKYRSIPDDEAALALAIAERINSLGSHQLLVEVARKRKASDREKAAARRNLQDMLGEISFAPGQLVLVRNFEGINSQTAETKVQDKWLGPYKVNWQGINGGVWVSTTSGQPLPSAIHSSHVKVYRPRIRPLLQQDGPQHQP